MYPDGYSPASLPLFRPPVKFQLHRPFEDHVVRSPDGPVESFVKPVASFLQYPDVHSTGLPLLLPPGPFQPAHPLQQFYERQRMRAAASEMERLTTGTDCGQDDSRAEDDDRSRSPDSPTQLTSDDGAVDDVEDATTTLSPDNHQNSSPASSKCESVFTVSCIHHLYFTKTGREKNQ